MPDLSAEAAYLFRHALLREGAYQLHLPADRARLHALALELVEAVLGDAVGDAAPELARHALLAQSGDCAEEELERLKREEVRWCEVAGRHAEKRFDFEELLEYTARVIDSSQATPHQHGNALSLMAFALQMKAHLGESEARYKELAEYALAHGEAKLHVQGVKGRMNVTWIRGNVEESETLCKEYVRLAEEQNDLAELAEARAMVAMMEFHRGEVGKARATMERAMPDVLAHCPTNISAIEHFHLGIFLQESGDLTAAQDAYEEAIRLAREAQRIDIEGRVLGSYGSLKQLTGDHQGAIEMTKRSIELSGRAGNIRGVGMQLTNLGVAYQKSGKVREALDWFVESLERCREHGAPDNIAFALVNVGIARFSLGEVAPALEAVRESVELWHLMRDTAWEAYTRVNYARMLRLTGELEPARECIRRAHELLEGSGSPSDELAAWLETGHQHLANGDAPQAKEALGQVQERLDKIGGDAIEAARKDRDLLKEAISAAEKGEVLLCGSRRSALPKELLDALES